jgi:hypothetical protein
VDEVLEDASGLILARSALAVAGAPRTSSNGSLLLSLAIVGCHRPLQLLRVLIAKL